MIPNKKGQQLIGLIELSVISLVMILFIGTFMYVMNIINDELSGGNILAGDTNISNYSTQTLGKINTGLMNGGDIIGILFLFGMIISIMVAGYMNRESSIPFLFMVDFIILIFSYILAVYISNSYETILTSLPFTSTIADNLANTSRFMLLLPSITVVTGAITMFLTYAGIPKSSTGGPEVAGF